MPEFAGPDDLDAESEAALSELLFRLADDEYVLAERYVEWQIYAPTLESDLALANIAQDEFGHARLWYDLLGELGYSEAECIWEKPAGEWRHATLVERPFEDGDWADAVVRGYLYDVAERLRLEALIDSSYAPIRDRVHKAIEEEEYHREHARNWLDRLTGDPNSESHERVQRALDRRFPDAALTLFASGEHEETIRELGLRTESLPALRSSWLETTVPYLESLGLAIPDQDSVPDPEAFGRDGDHTDVWPELLAELTETYESFGFGDPVQLRGESS